MDAKFVNRVRLRNVRKFQESTRESYFREQSFVLSHTSISVSHFNISQLHKKDEPKIKSTNDSSC